MKIETLLLVLALGGAARLNAADQSNAPNAKLAARQYDPIKEPFLDAEMQALIDTWPKGAATNGIYCALQIDRHGHRDGSDPSCAVNVINTTTNFLSSFWRLPQETLYQMELLGPDGKPVEKTAAGNHYMGWTEKQMEYWYRHERLRGGNHFDFWPKANQQIGSIRIPRLFQLKQTGEYTLYFRLRLVERKQGASKGVQTLWLPEVVAKVQIRPEEIPQPKIPPPRQTNAAPK